ncbi:MAG: hypothetical protein H6509_13620 [Bryobacterales bacterium]|nr:hypothetical protein [Bryobacterales bacterium]
MSELRLTAYREKALGILAIVFVAGLATGVLGTRAYDRHADAANSDPLQQQVAVAMDRLRGDLNLNDEQAERVQAILDHYIMFEADLLSQVRSLQQQGRKEILEVLDAEQRSKFETMVRPVSAGP